MGFFQVMYNSSVVNYNRRGFIRLATGFEIHAILILTSLCSVTRLIYSSMFGNDNNEN